MAYRFFERNEHSSLYEKYMIREPDEVMKLILSYLEEKKGKPFQLAVDVGCGTGQSTRSLAAFDFQKVIGVDISDAQIQEACSVGSSPKVSYMLAPAEQLPFEDGSVDLITASVSAHWFNMEMFLSEVERVLKPRGCLAMYCLYPFFDLHYKDCSKALTDVFTEVTDFLLREYGGEGVKLMLSEYKEIFDAVPFVDKTRVTKILLKRSMPVADLVGLCESICTYQNFLRADREAAEEFLQKLQHSLLEIMGTSSTATQLEICTNYVCVLACKSV
ncbi:putative methyltransferase DDB_G0268948 isoform X2 [Ambystoma mexicanum]